MAVRQVVGAEVMGAGGGGWTEVLVVLVVLLLLVVLVLVEDEREEEEEEEEEEEAAPPETPETEPSGCFRLPLVALADCLTKAPPAASEEDCMDSSLRG